MPNIKLKNVSLRFPIYSGANKSLKKSLLRNLLGGKVESTSRFSYVKSLNSISLDISEGDRVALIGQNGSGKSTLLRVISGIYSPTSGYVNINGSISTLINIAIGIEPDATGIENIFLRGLLMNMTKTEIQSKIQEIINFTDLQDYIYLPVKTYSTGMLSRLAFAIATSKNSDILLLDELIGTGDKFFINKVRQRLKNIIEFSKIVVIASHNQSLLKNICNKAIYLDRGNLIEFGSYNDVVNIYNRIKK